MEIRSNVHGPPSNIMNMGTPARSAASIRWTLLKTFGEYEGSRLYRALKKDIERYRKLLFEDVFYQAHAEMFVLFRSGQVLAESDGFDDLVVGFLPQAEAGYYLVCHVARYSHRQPYPYHPVPWIFTGWNHDLSEEEVENLLDKNSRWVWRVFG